MYLTSKVRNKGTGETGSITVNFYNKEHQYRNRREKEIKRSGESKITDEMIAQAKDILRLEIQCHRPKLDSLKDKPYYLPDRRIITLLQHPEIAQRIIGHYVSFIAKAADYQRKPVALKMVESLKCKDQTKENIKLILNKLSVQHADINAVKNILIGNGAMSAYQFKYAMQKLIQAGINPVTISEDDSLTGKSWKEGLESVYTLFWSAFYDEMNFESQEEPEEEITDLFEIQ